MWIVKKPRSINTTRNNTLNLVKWPSLRVISYLRKTKIWFFKVAALFFFRTCIHDPRKYTRVVVQNDFLSL